MLLKKWGCCWWWVSNRSGWLLELLTELTKTRKTKISHNLQAGGLLDIVPAPRRRSWRTEEAKGGKSKEDEVVESKLKSHLYVNLPERSSSYDYGRGRLQSKGFEVHVPVCQETTPL